MHGVLPANAAGVAAILRELFELGKNVVVVGLIDRSREENGAHGEQILGKWSGKFDERGIEAFKDVGIGAQSEAKKLLELPVTFLGFVALQLFRQAPERPLFVSRRKIDAAAIAVGAGFVEAVRARADHASVDDVFVEVVRGRAKNRKDGLGAFFARLEGAARKIRKRSIGKAHAVGRTRSRRSFNDDPDGPRFVEQHSFGRFHLSESSDLRASGNDVNSGFARGGHRLRDHFFSREREMQRKALDAAVKA